LVEEALAYFPPCPAKLDRESRSKQLALLQASGSLESPASQPSQAAAEATERSLGTCDHPGCYVTSSTIRATGYGDATPGYDHRGFLPAGGDIRLRVVDLNRHGKDPPYPPVSLTYNVHGKTGWARNDWR